MAASYVYVKSPIFACAARAGGGVLASAGGGSSKSGVSNLLLELRCRIDGDGGGDKGEGEGGADEAAGARVPRLRVLAELETGPEVVHSALAAAAAGGLVAALSVGSAACTLYRWSGGAAAATSAAVRVASPLTVLRVFVAARDEAELTSVAFSPDGRHLALGDERGRVYLWRMLEAGADGDVLPYPPPLLLASLAGHSAKVTALAFDGTAQRLVSASADDTCRVWECGATLAALRSPAPVAALPITSHVIAGQGRTALGNRFVRRPRNARAGAAAAGAGRWQFRGAALAADGGALFALETSERGGAVVVKWRCGARGAAAATTLAPIELVRADGSRPEAAATAATAAEASPADTSRWRLSTWAVAAQSPAATMVLNAAGDRLCVGTNDGTVRLFDCDALGAPLWSRSGVHQFPVTCAAFVDGEAADSSDNVLVTGSPDAQLAVVPLVAPAGGGRLSPRTTVLLLLLLLLALAGAALALYVTARSAFGADEAGKGDEL